MFRLSTLWTVFALVGAVWFVPAVDSRTVVQSKRGIQQELGAAPDTEQEPLISEGLRDKIARDPLLRAQVIYTYQILSRLFLKIKQLPEFLQLGKHYFKRQFNAKSRDPNASKTKAPFMKKFCLTPPMMQNARKDCTFPAIQRRATLINPQGGKAGQSQHHRIIISWEELGE